MTVYCNLCEQSLPAERFPHERRDRADGFCLDCIVKQDAEEAARPKPGSVNFKPRTPIEEAKHRRLRKSANFANGRLQ